ncbi:MAG: phosphatase PAP2 family protein [Treponema sp.]|jgi:membrane-associated phospholipid phosphatase|nr:phosphatase PAP2 family protein [Treponema sp.]
MENLQEMYQWGIDLIKVIQLIENPVLSAVLVFITTLGAGVFYMLALFFIIWCVDDRMGIRLAVLTLVSAWANSLLKVTCKQPRPYNLDPSVGRALESSYGFPSGHAQSVLVFFMSLATWLKKPAVYIAAILITLVMSFTRLYLGVHFPTDIFGGWIAGLIVLGLYWIFADRIIKVLAVASIRFRLIISAAASFVMLILCPSDLRMPGLILGLGMGYSVMIHYFPFDVKKKKDGLKAGPLTLLLRYILGAACAGLVMFFGSLFTDMLGEASSAYRIAEFTVHGLVGGAATALVPWLFIKTGLSVKKE